MSIKYILAAMESKVGNPGRKLVLIKLADNANDSGECYPSYQYIADHCEMGRRTVIGHIDRLERDGFLVVSSRKTVNGFTSNSYKLVFSRGADSAPPLVQNLHHPSADSAPPLVQNLHLEPVTSLTCHLTKGTSHKKFTTNPDQVADFLSNKILSENPGAKINPSGWLADIDKAIRIDGRTGSQLIDLVEWIYTGSDGFWKSNILSGKKLRDKFDQISMQMNSIRGSGNGAHKQIQRQKTRNQSFADKITEDAIASGGSDFLEHGKYVWE